jgi:transposase InsO family protein
MDLFVVPTIGFDLLYAFVIVRLDRRDLVWINVTANPTAEWVAHQITEAFPWDEAPHYLIRDRDRIYGTVVTRRLRAMGIRDRPTAPASPWQNGVVERLIGSIRRECVDHIIVLGEMHLRRVLKSYADASILEQGCAGFSPGSANRCDQFTRHPGRTSSPLRPRLGCRYTQPGLYGVVTASFGVASAFVGELTAAELISVADTALYPAKRKGRNQVWPPLAAPSDASNIEQISFRDRA